MQNQSIKNRRKLSSSRKLEKIDVKKSFTIITFLAVFSIPFYPNVLSISKNSASASWSDINLDFDYSIDSEISDFWDSDFISPVSLLSDDRETRSKNNIAIYIVKDSSCAFYSLSSKKLNIKINFF